MTTNQQRLNGDQSDSGATGVSAAVPTHHSHTSQAHVLCYVWLPWSINQELYVIVFFVFTPLLPPLPPPPSRWVSSESTVFSVGLLFSLTCILDPFVWPGESMFACNFEYMPPILLTSELLCVPVDELQQPLNVLFWWPVIPALCCRWRTSDSDVDSHLGP